MQMRRLLTESALETLYGKLPVPLQNAACWYYGFSQARIRYGPTFHDRFPQLVESDFWPRSRIVAYQDEQLRNIVDHAYRTTSFYRERMQSAGISPRDIESRADLERLPLLTKEEVRSGLHRMISSTARKRDLIQRKTSGTTGKSLSFYRSKASIAFQWAIWWRHRNRFGLERGDWHVHFTPKLVVPPEQHSPPYWRRGTPMKQIFMNAHHFVPEKIEDIVRYLDRNPVGFYSGYPSYIHVLALTAREAGLELTSRPRVVWSGAENLLERQRRDIEDFTGAIVTDHYGMSEACGAASQCSEGLYHEDFEFGILECLDRVKLDDGRVMGRIVCTGFGDEALPFIRYETGDVGVWSRSDEKCACGRESPTLVEIRGRAQDYVVTPEGRRIMRFDSVFRDTSNVKESQVVQERPGEIRVRIVKRPGYGASDEDFIAEEIARTISPTLKVAFEYVSEIERESGGKFKAVKSLIEDERERAVLH
jgi:phenylacetate-CoA ligase